MNHLIRQDMRNYIDNNGPQHTRFMIDHFSKVWNVSKQRISGNISAMATVLGMCTVISNAPNSMMY